MFVKARWIISFVVAFSALARAADQPIDGKIQTTNGNAVSLRALWGKPAVLFYEDKDATALNQVLKDELFKQGKEHDLLKSVTVVAVANLKGFNWFPARNFARDAVADTEKKVGIPVYVDFDATLQAAPLSLPATGAVVLVVDRKGNEVLRKKGKLDQKGIEEVLTKLKALLEPAP